MRMLTSLNLIKDLLTYHQHHRILASFAGTFEQDAHISHELLEPLQSQSYRPAFGVHLSNRRSQWHGKFEAAQHSMDISGIIIDADMLKALHNHKLHPANIK